MIVSWNDAASCCCVLCRTVDLWVMRMVHTSTATQPEHASSTLQSPPKALGPAKGKSLKKHSQVSHKPCPCAECAECAELSLASSCPHTPHSPRSLPRPFTARAPALAAQHLGCKCHAYIYIITLPAQSSLLFLIQGHVPLEADLHCP